MPQDPMFTVRLHVMVTPETKAALERIRKKLGYKAEAEVVREGLDLLIEKHLPDPYSGRTRLLVDTQENLYGGTVSHVVGLEDEPAPKRVAEPREPVRIRNVFAGPPTHGPLADYQVNPDGSVDALNAGRRDDELVERVNERFGTWLDQALAGEDPVGRHPGVE